MRLSRQWVPTLKEVPQEAEIPSHQLLLRAGMIRRLSAGLYTFLPMGVRALHKVEQIVREEMDRAGALEVLMPAMHPRELWEQTGRMATMGQVMFQLEDRQNRQLVLGPTHEEVITYHVSHEISSYRQMPRTFYQIQGKFRDEIRPRFGLMRAKEFVMKDAYSFDADDAGMDVSYQAMYDAYVRIFQRCGVRAKAVEADTGAIGGSSSHEFMVLADAGEDGIAECESCTYAANLERAESRLPAGFAWPEDGAAAAPVATPGRKTIEEVSAFLSVPAAQLIKTLVYEADGSPVVVLCGGDRVIHDIKLKKVLGAAQVVLASDEVVQKVTGAPVGFAGPVGLAAVRIVADAKLQGARGMVTGANRADLHLCHVDLARDVKDMEWGDVTAAKDGDRCPRCEGMLRDKRGIEVGHVFKLGTKYSESLNATFLDPAGERKPILMGCYGIGISRTLQSVVEQCHDANGIIWPLSVAPCEVALLCLNVKDAACLSAADKLYHELQALGVEVLYDDRDERPGVKFKDADLVGLPLRLSVGERSLARGMVELKERKSGVQREVAPSQAADEVAAWIAREKEALKDGTRL